MSLKTRFFLLILGTVLIPNIIIITMVGFSFGGLQHIRTLHTQMKSYYLLSEMLKKPVAHKDLYRFLDDLPSDLDYYIMNGSHKVLHSSTGNSDLNNALQKDRKLQVLVVSYKDGTRAILLIHLPVFEDYTLLRSTPLGIIAPLLLLSVFTLLSLGVIRSINISLRRIEEATRKVADGSFDFELPVKGNDSIASLSRSFNIMVHEVKEGYARRSRFFMGVSHDLKTPLSSISGYADAILEGYADNTETLYKYVRIIKDKSGLLLDRIYHLIDFVRLETGDWKVSFKDILVKNFLSEIVDAASVDAELYKYTFESNIRIREEVSVSMDRELVSRIFDNIIHNAFRYSFEGSAINFNAVEADGSITISIMNRGKGIPENDLKYIFEPFYRGSSSRNEEGFGLGLANVASVIKSHGWKIDVESVPGETTTFTIVIPLP